jgi:hypothetical protein
MGGWEGAYQSYMIEQEWDIDDPDCPRDYLEYLGLWDDTEIEIEIEAVKYEGFCNVA